eukprot:scaffold11437_cov176-Skeletonema_marinoi.AAC.3
MSSYGRMQLLLGSIQTTRAFEYIVGVCNLGRFNPQALSNTVWAYATADMHHPQLFEKVANHIAESDSLDRSDPQALSNIVWAYATAGINHPRLFEKVANHIAESDGLGRFNSQNLSNIVWAYATANVRHPKLFEKVANHIAGLETWIDSSSKSFQFSMGVCYCSSSSSRAVSESCRGCHPT